MVKVFHSALLRMMPNPQAGFKTELEGMVVLLNTVAFVLAQLVVVCVVTVVVVVIPPGDVCEAVDDVVATTGAVAVHGMKPAPNVLLFSRTTPL